MGGHPQPEGARTEGADCGAGGMSVLPVQVDRGAAAHAHPAEAALTPAVRQGGQEVDEALVALQEHLADAGRAAVVAVNLERRMGAEQVGEGAAAVCAGLGVHGGLEEAAEQLPGAVAVAQPCPEVHLPRPAPAGGLVAAAVEGDAAGLGQVGGAEGRDEVGGMQAVEVGDVAVMHIHLAVILQPLLQVALPADLHRGELLQVGLQAGHEVGVTAQRAGGGDDVGIEFGQQLHVHRGAHADADGVQGVARQVEGILRRRGGCRDQPAVTGLAHGGGGEEQGCTPQDGIDALQVGPVLRILPVLPQMGAEPCPARVGGSPRGVLAGGGIVPDIGHHMEHPALGILAVEGAGGLLTRGDEAFHQRGQGLVELGEAGLLQGPVVHLDIDVGVVVAVPRGERAVGPKALQVGGQGAGARAADEEVAAVVVIQGGQAGSGMLRKAQEAFARGQGIVRRGGQGEGDAVVEVAVGGDVRLLQPGHVIHGIQQAVAHRCIALAGEVRARCRKGGRGGQDQPGFPAILQGNAPLRGNAHVSTLGQQAHTHAVLHALPVGIAAGELAIHPQHIPFHGERGILGTAQAGGEGQGARPSGGQADQHHVTVARDEVGTPVAHAAPGEGGMGHTVAQGEGADIVRRLAARIGEVNVQVAQHLVGAVASVGLLLLGDEAAVHQLLGLQVLALEEQLSDGGEALGGIGVAVVGLRAAPQGYFIEDNVLAVDTPVGHHAQASIAQGEGLLPDGGRGGVPQAVVAGVGRHRSGRQSEREHRPKKGYQGFHKGYIYLYNKQSKGDPKDRPCPILSYSSSKVAVPRMSVDDAPT